MVLDSYKVEELDFDPISERNDYLRAKYWDNFVEGFVPIRGALSSLSLFKGEMEICRRFLTKKGGGGRLLKLDLWDELFLDSVLFRICKNYDEICGVDIAPMVVKKCKEIFAAKRLPIKARLGDIRDLPYHDGTFDFIYSMGTIEHIPRPVEAMRECYRVLRKGGRAAIGVPNKYEWFGRALVLEVLASFGVKLGGHEICYGWKRLTEEVESCGFRVVAKTGIYFMPWFVRMGDWFFYQRSKRFKYLFFLPIVLCNFLGKIEWVKRYGGGQLVVVVERP